MFHTTREIATTVGVSIPTILAWERDGRIPRATAKVGGKRKRLWNSIAYDRILKIAREEMGYPVGGVLEDTKK